MNPGNGKGSISPATSRVGWKSAEPVAGQFPVGLRVMVVDDDPTCLVILENMLRTCLYQVKKCSRAEEALSILRENRNGYDIVISDVHMPDMDGFKLLELVGLEMDLPVIMMSADDSKQVVMKAVTHGACDYLIKPVRIDALKNIWQHVVRKKRNEWKEVEQSGSADEGETRQPKLSEDADYSSSANESNWRNSKRLKDDDEDGEDRDDTSTLKKPRVVWSVKLHRQFVAAVNQLGIDKAVPEKILELMNVPGLTRENVASHLQKYRSYLRRLSGVSQHQQQHLSGGKQMNLLHGIPTNMEPKQLVNLHHPGSSLGSMNVQVNSHGGQNIQSRSLLTQMSQPQPRAQMLNDTATNHMPRIPSQPMMSNARTIMTRNGLDESRRPMGCNPVSQSSVMNFPLNSPSELRINNSYPNQNNPPVTSLTSKGAFQEDATSELKGAAGFMPSYDIFSDLNQQRAHDWELQNVGVTFNAPQQASALPSNIEVGSSVVSHQGFTSNQASGQAMNASIASKSMYPAAALEHVNNTISVGQHMNNFYRENNSVSIKVESIDSCNQNPLFHEQFGQDDLMSALLKQQQQGVIGPTERDPTLLFSSLLLFISAFVIFFIFFPPYHLPQIRFRYFSW